MTTYSSEPFTVWWPRPKSSKTEAKQEIKKTYTTNYVAGSGKSADDVSLPRIATGGTVPLVLGRDVVRNPDIMWYGNLKPVSKSEVTQDVVTDASGNQTITTTITTTVVAYTVDIQFCVGLGPGMRLRSIFIDNVAIWTGTQGPVRSTFTVVGSDVITDVIFAGGNFDQAVDPYLDNLIAQELSGYRGYAYVILKSLDTTKLSNISFEVDRYPDPLALGASNKVGDELNTASAMAEIITRTWGGAGQSASIIGASFGTVAAQLFGEGNGVSLINRNNVSANELNSIILEQIDGTLYEDHETGKIEVSLYRDEFDRTNLLRIFDNDILDIKLNKTTWKSTTTSIKLSYTDRGLVYRNVPMVARNLASSSKLSRSSVEVSFPAVKTGALAADLLSRVGTSVSSPTQQVTVVTGRKAAGCNPGDVILITCSKYKYYSIPAIVLKRRTQPVENNMVTLICNVILYPHNKVLFAAPEGSFFVPIDPNPHAPVSVKMFSAPYFLRFTSTSVNGTFDYLSNQAVRDYTN